MIREQDTVHLPKQAIPRRWYNLHADLPAPMQPPLHPGTRQPLGPGDMAPIFPEALIEQEMSLERWISIPEEVMDAYAIWRPTPLVRARRLEQALALNVQIWYKYEGVSPAGSHKPNTAIPQAWYNRQAGVRRLTTETGAGQWGSSLSFACQRYGLECTIYMVRASHDSKPYRRTMMRLWGGEVFASPSERTQSGRAVRARHGADMPGSLGIAISEAVEDAVQRDDTKYALGSVLNHVLLHQTVIGQETRTQLELAGVEPDVLVGCVGGGSNFGGFAFPFIGAALRGESPACRIVAVEPTACPTITKGKLDYDYGDIAGLTPMLRMHTLGHEFVPPSIHSGGLRYHGMAPLVSAAVEHGWVEGAAVDQTDVFAACQLFLSTEGILPAPEAGHALLGAINEAKCLHQVKPGGSVVFNLCGHGFLDLPAYEAFIEGRLRNEV